MITELSHEFPPISHRLLHEVVMITLDWHKFSARYVPKMLTKVHKNVNSIALSFLETYNRDSYSLVDCIVTEDET